MIQITKCFVKISIKFIPTRSSSTSRRSLQAQIKIFFLKQIQVSICTLYIERNKNFNIRGNISVHKRNNRQIQ